MSITKHSISVAALAEGKDRRIAKLEQELVRRGKWHHPNCRKMIYDHYSSPCTCEAVFAELEQENARLLAEIALITDDGTKYAMAYNRGYESGLRAGKG